MNAADRPQTWDLAVAAFSDHMRTDSTRSQPVRWQYAQHVRWLASAVDVGPWDVSTADLTTWLDAQNWSAETRRKVLVSLRAFYSWAVQSRHLEWAPTAGIARRAQRAPGPKARALPEAWRGPIEEYMANLRAGSRAESTIDMYRTRLLSLVHAAADPWAVTTQQLAKWLANPDWSPATKRGHQVAAGSFYRWAARSGYIAESPAVDLDTVRVPRNLPRPAADDCIRDALHNVDDRARIAIMLGAYAGLRRVEIANLHMTQISLSPAQLLVIGKGGHHRLVPLDPRGELAEALAAERTRRERGAAGSGFVGNRFAGPDGYLFPNPKTGRPVTANHLGRIIADALGGDVTTHQLRHRFATHAYAAERDLLAVQQLLGHSRPETTSVYAQVPDGALRAAVMAAGHNIVTGRAIGLAPQ